MRRSILPVIVLAVAIAASFLAGQANDAADPNDPAGDDAVSLTTPVLSMRRTPEWLRQPTTSNLLAAAVQAPIDTVGQAGAVCASVHVNGEPVTDIAATQAFIPGEIQRLLTVIALDTLGSGGFTTEVVRSGDAVINDEGVLEGDLWLIGGADPVLSTDDYISRFGDDRAFTPLEELVADTVAALRDEGITAIGGQVIGVDAKYAGTPQVFGDFWTNAEIASGTVGVTSGLLVDNGLSSFPTEVDLASDVRSADGTAHAASVFASLLNGAEMPVVGGSSAGDAPATISRQSVARISSPPLDDIAKRALVDGTTAEMLWREIAVRSGNPFGALAAVNASLVELGLLPNDEAGNFPKYDGSGLSLLNRARCDTFTGALDGDASSLAAESLPPVETTSLADCAPAGLTSLHVLAAARPEVTSMAGRAVAGNGDVITFSMIANWLPGENGAYAPQAVCDGLFPAVLEAIADHPAGPLLEQLTPLPAG
ncbi:MAG: D-alanyl-D-alanine carboxypeptidase [Acidimicrobiales bacterium]